MYFYYSLHFGYCQEVIFIFSKNIFCERLSQLRKQKKLTLEQFGLNFNVTKQTTSRWEKGDRLPPLDVVIEIADFFDVSLDYLVGRSDDPTCH